MEMKRINFGGGSKKYPGFLILDLRKDADIVCDMRKGIPLEDSSVIEGKCEHILEHFAPGEELLGVMNELWRVMHPDGVLTVEVPSAEHLSAFQDPTHKTFWVPKMFEYFDHEKDLFKDEGIHYGIKPWRFIPQETPPGEFMRRYMQPVKTPAEMQGKKNKSAVETLWEQFNSLMKKLKSNS